MLERVRAAMQTGPNDVTVKLDRPVPVFIVYATALAYENGEVHFYDDIYGHDAEPRAGTGEGLPVPVTRRSPPEGDYQRRTRPTSTCTKSEAA